jgi:hypothetical protein
MRIVLIACVFSLAVLASCTKPNQKFCCVTEEQCSAAGVVDELRPCGAGQACKETVCVEKECDTSADCTSQDAPSCVNNLCVAGCGVDDDCLGVPGKPHCDIDGTCVGCFSNDQCPTDKAICDLDTRSCRGCTGDDQCASGVCIEADGICAADTEILYVTQLGVDSGGCAKTAPCRTITYASGFVTATKRVIRILSGNFSTDANTVALGQAIVIDGSNTTLALGGAPMFSVGDRATVEGVRTTSNAEVFNVAVGGRLKIAATTIESGRIAMLNGGSIEMSDVKFVNGDMDLRNGSVTIIRGDFDRSPIATSNCELSISASRLGPGLDTINASSGLVTIENNVFVATVEGENLLRFVGHAPGSTFRFNTVVNTSTIQSSGTAIGCDNSIEMTSNIIAYNTTIPFSSQCVVRHTLFDLAGAQAAMGGTANVSADGSTFFRDRSNGDFHLPSTSPALGLGEPGLVTIDRDGNARPAPMGSAPDVGAYEAP